MRAEYLVAYERLAEIKLEAERNNHELARTINRLEQERDEALRWLKFLYDKWENGTPCFEDPEDLEGPVGNAFKLSDAEEESILSLLRQAESPKESINVSA